MAEHVVDADLHVRWQPNVEHGVLVVNEMGEARLRLDPHVDDVDRRRVVLAWHQTLAARMEPPNDEAISGRRLYDAGLREVIWVGEVRESSLLAALEEGNREHPRHRAASFEGYRHWIVRLKGRVVEVIAGSCDVQRG